MAGVIEELNEKVRRETAEKVRRETLLESTLDFAAKLIMQGKLTKEEIAAVCSLSLEEVKALAAKNSLQTL